MVKRIYVLLVLSLWKIFLSKYEGVYRSGTMPRYYCIRVRFLALKWNVYTVRTGTIIQSGRKKEVSFLKYNTIRYLPVHIEEYLYLRSLFREAAGGEGKTRHVSHPECGRIGEVGGTYGNSYIIWWKLNVFVKYIAVYLFYWNLQYHAVSVFRLHWGSVG